LDRYSDRLGSGIAYLEIFSNFWIDTPTVWAAELLTWKYFQTFGSIQRPSGQRNCLPWNIFKHLDRYSDRLGSGIAYLEIFSNIWIDTATVWTAELLTLKYFQIRENQMILYSH
jgi:hypothetical protein